MLILPSTCTNTFPSSRKHYRNHTRPVWCNYCDDRFAENKEYHRHMWTTHPIEAATLDIPGKRVECTHPGCSYHTRRPDNLRRHQQTKNH